MKINEFNLIISEHSTKNYQPSFDIINEFQDTITKSKDSKIIKSNILVERFYKLIYFKLHIPIHLALGDKKKDSTIFSIQMGPNYGKIFPYCINNTNTYAYFFDIWPKFFVETAYFIKKSKIKHVFLSSNYAAEYFKKSGFENVSWIPEGILLDEYKYLPNTRRDIDVLELGRKNVSIHDKITEVLFVNQKIHLFEEKPGQLIFKKKEDLVSGMARTKISICFPKSETHPEIAGPIGTMTNRYLQSMASKSLIVGSAPEEMEELFGYNPVIEIDRSDPAQHLLDILNNFNEYQPLIDKNYDNLMLNHTWECRWKSIEKTIHQYTI